KFVGDYNATYSEPYAENSVAEFSFDAAFLLAYAAAAESNAPALNGQVMAEGMARMAAPSEFKFTVEAGDIQKVFSALTQPSKQNIELTGATGLIDFDPATGNRRGVFEMWCISKPGVGASGFIPAGIAFDYSQDTKDGSVSGTFDAAACE